MKKQYILPLAILTASVWAWESCTPPASSRAASSTNISKNNVMQVKYPTTRRDENVSDNYHGTVINDPFRWLEDDNSEETKAWVKAQNEVTFGYLAQIPYRAQLKKRLEQIWNYEKYGAPFKEGGKYYFFKNDGLQNQSTLYVQNALNAPPSVFFDPNALSKDGTVALGAISFNKNGSLMAYQVSEAGSDWQTIKIKNAATGETLKDELKWVKFSGIAWEGNGFYYSRYPEPAKGDALKGRSTFQKVYFHQIGTPQSDDVLVFEDTQNANRGFGCVTTKDERFVCVTPWETTSGNALHIWDKKSDKDLGFVPIVSSMDKDFDVIDNNGDWILLQTNHNAPNTRVVAVNINQPDEKNWKEIVAETKDVLQATRIVGGKLVLTYLHNASSLVKIYSLDGKFIADLKLPDVGTVGGFSGNRNEAEAFFSFSSFTRPSTIYSLDMNTLSSQVFKAPKIDFEVDKYETKQVWFTSKDGTKVPMFIVHKKGVELNGKNPTLLYGYGGFNISMLPGFALTRTLLLENGGIYAVANLRGGGEFGEAWHKAGTKERKQNVFDDFIAAAEYLIANKYCTKEYLAIEGGSNGGLLVGACMTQRPDLYRVAFPRVGVLDMLRYHKFTIGRAWAVDYGLSENADEFKYLIKYSPLHNVRPTAYPSTMVMTADHDDRVVPAHSFKFAAELQAKHNGKNPALIRIETAAGHGAGKPTSKMIEEAVDAVAFMFYEMGISIK